MWYGVCSACAAGMLLLYCDNSLIADDMLLAADDMFLMSDDKYYCMVA